MVGLRFPSGDPDLAVLDQTLDMRAGMVGKDGREKAIEPYAFSRRPSTVTRPFAISVAA